MITFDDLHAEIKKDCNCLQYGEEPNASHTYYRRGSNIPALLTDFLSLHEQKKPVRGTTCKEHCHHRGVSLWRITIDLAKRKEQLIAAKQFAPAKEPVAYFIRVRSGAGLIWSEDAKEHCELLKADAFKLDLLEFVDVFDTSTT